MAADLTLLNLNMLYVRYADAVERELHLPLGCLYLTRVLADAGYEVDLRDYQRCEADEPFSPQAVCDYLEHSAALVGVSVMANLLPFAILALKRFKELHPEKVVVLGGVGAKAIERPLLERFPWINAIAYGEGERMIVPLVEAIKRTPSSKPLHERLTGVPNLYYRDGNGSVVQSPPAPRVENLDTLPFPAWDRIDLPHYQGFGVMASRGCPYPCTFCSVAPVWDHHSTRRSDENIVAEMEALHRLAGADLFLFQDEYFVLSPAQVEGFCSTLEKRRLDVEWKAFGRINLSTPQMMKRMADGGCLELRFGIESASNRVLEKCKKGFVSEDALRVVGEAVKHFARVDTFFVWGFPFETMADFQLSLFQMIAFRMLGARVLPSLLCLLPQTDIFHEYGDEGRALEFCRQLFPEYMLTGHEVCDDAEVRIEDEHGAIFDFITEHPDLFPGFFHYDVAGNVLPKLRALQEMGFYLGATNEAAISVERKDSCGAHSPRVGHATTAKAQLSVG